MQKVMDAVGEQDFLKGVEVTEANASEVAESVRQNEIEKATAEVMHVLAFAGEVYAQRDYYLEKLNLANNTINELNTRKNSAIEKLKNLGGEIPTFQLD